MKALNLLYKESMAMPKVVRGGKVTASDVERFIKKSRKAEPAKPEFSMQRVLNGVRWGGLGLGLGAAGYVASK